MITDNEVKKRGMEILINELGEVEAEHFVALIIKERFDYTEWQKDLWKDVSVATLSKQAMNYVSKQGG
ncbi:MAG: hypothetical protein ACE5GG_02715 [Candidatus Omnitrophota bacterium]